VPGNYRQLRITVILGSSVGMDAKPLFIGNCYAVKTRKPYPIPSAKEPTAEIPLPDYGPLIFSVLPYPLVFRGVELTRSLLISASSLPSEQPSPKTPLTLL
jgi:hypothetical protein